MTTDKFKLVRAEARAAQEKAAGTTGVVIHAACHWGGPKEQIFGRTRFQMDFIAAVAARPGFQHFCGNPQYDGMSDFGGARVYTGPFSLSWFEADVLRVVWLGAKRVLEGEGATK